MKKILVVVDYQQDFVSGSLGFNGAESLDPNICRKIDVYRQAGDQVVFTFDTHNEDYLSTQEGKYLPVPHCIKGSPGWALYGKTAQKRLPQDRVFYKPAFGSAELFDYLRGGQYTTVELVGLVSNICVLSNAVLAKTALPQAKIIVDSSCTASHDPALHAAAMQVLQGLQITVL